MTTPTLAFGRRPPKNAPALRLAPLLTGVLPRHPMAQDNLARFPSWEMLGNDTIGDCVAVTWANVRRLVTGTLTASEYYPSFEQVVAVYRSQNPDFDPDGDPRVNGPGSSADQGMDIQTLLELLVKVGGPDGAHAVAFARVDHTDVEEVKAAIAIFGYVWVGVTVTAANEGEFRRSRPWDYDEMSPDLGGHSVITGGYTGEDHELGDETFITWATETSFTDDFWANQVDEAWIVIWPEHLGTSAFLEGVDRVALAEAYEAITGRVLPNPAPPVPGPHPEPEPSPEPPPTADQVLANAAKEFLQHRHSGAPLAMAHALQTWMTEKGL